MSKVLNTLMLVAAMLWSSVCFAECRILPPKPEAAVPPCHKQQQQSQHKTCVDPGACVFEVAPAGDQQQLASSGDLSDVPALTVAALGDELAAVYAVPVFTSGDLTGVVRPRTSVLRI